MVGRHKTGLQPLFFSFGDLFDFFGSNIETVGTKGFYPNLGKVAGNYRFGEIPVYYFVGTMIWIERIFWRTSWNIPVFHGDGSFLLNGNFYFWIGTVDLSWAWGQGYNGWKIVFTNPVSKMAFIIGAPVYLGVKLAHISFCKEQDWSLGNEDIKISGGDWERNGWCNIASGN